MKATAFLCYQPRHQFQLILSCILRARALIKSSQVHVFVHILSTPELHTTNDLLSSRFCRNLMRYSSSESAIFSVCDTKTEFTTFLGNCNVEAALTCLYLPLDCKQHYSTPPKKITLVRPIPTMTFQNSHVDITLVVYLSGEGCWILCQPHLLLLLLLASSSSSSASSSPPLLRPSAPGSSASCSMALCTFKLTAHISMLSVHLRQLLISNTTKRPRDVRDAATPSLVQTRCSMVTPSCCATKSGEAPKICKTKRRNSSSTTTH